MTDTPCLICSRPARRPSSAQPVCAACQVSVSGYKGRSDAELAISANRLRVECRRLYVARYGFDALDRLTYPPVDLEAKPHAR